MRSEIHEAVGGSFRHGMTSCLDGDAFMIFHNPDGGKRFGYDVWEGFDVNGDFHFTGQGKIGDQKLTKNNKKLLETVTSLLPIHLFMTTGDGQPYVYFGEFCLGSPPYETEVAPDENGNERKVFVFSLTPVGRTIRPLLPKNLLVTVSQSVWSAPTTDDLNKKYLPTTNMRVNQREHQMQKYFGEFLVQSGVEIFNVSISTPGSTGSVRPDFYIQEPPYVIEAKASSGRDFVRQAIGQVLDYKNLLNRGGVVATPAILLPDCPSDDLVALLESLNIELITGDEQSMYQFSSAPVLSANYAILSAVSVSSNLKEDS